MSAPYQLALNPDLPLASVTQNVVLGQPGQTLNEPSRVKVYATRESVDVTMGFTLGQQVIMPVDSPTNINTVIGSLPSIQDDLLAEGWGVAGDDIIIQARNVNAAAQQLSLLIKVVAADDIASGLIT